MTMPPADPTSSNKTLLDAIQRLEDCMDERMTQMKKELALGLLLFRLGAKLLAMECPLLSLSAFFLQI